jgi:hypothetical protein
MNTAYSTIPSGYCPSASYDPRRKILRLNLGSVPLWLLSGVLLTLLAREVRPELSVMKLLEGMSGSYAILLQTVGLCFVVFGIVVFLHEAVHYASMWALSHRRPHFHLDKKRIIPYVTPGVGIYFRRRAALFCMVAPVLLISGIGVALLFYCPLSLVPAFVFLMATNIGISISDIDQFLWLRSQKPDIVWGFDGTSSLTYEPIAQQT